MFENQVLKFYQFFVPQAPEALSSDLSTYQGETLASIDWIMSCYNINLLFMDYFQAFQHKFRLDLELNT